VERRLPPQRRAHRDVKQRRRRWAEDGLWRRVYTLRRRGHPHTVAALDGAAVCRAATEEERKKRTGSAYSVLCSSASHHRLFISCLPTRFEVWTGLSADTLRFIYPRTAVLHVCIRALAASASPAWDGFGRSSADGRTLQGGRAFHVVGSFCFSISVLFSAYGYSVVLC
jgi:hypothetical protein